LGVLGRQGAGLALGPAADALAGALRPVHLLDHDALVAGAAASLALLLPLGALGVALVAADDAAGRLLLGAALAVVVLLLLDVPGGGGGGGGLGRRAEQVLDRERLVALHQLGRDVRELAGPGLRGLLVALVVRLLDRRGRVLGQAAGRPRGLRRPGHRPAAPAGAG